MQKLLPSLTAARRDTEPSAQKRLAAFKYMKADFGVHQCANVSSASLPCTRGRLERRGQMLPGCWHLM